MFTSIPSLDSVLQCLLPAFTQPSFQTHIEVLLGWVMCLSKRTEYGVFQTIQADTPVSRKERHPFDRFYNFFSHANLGTHYWLCCKTRIVSHDLSSGRSPLQRDDPRQVLQVALVDLAGRVIGCRGFRAYQRLGAPAVFRNMGAIAAIAADDRVQVAAALLGKRKAGLPPVGIGQKLA
jgi:hypothetical protein